MGRSEQEGETRVAKEGEGDGEGRSGGWSRKERG